MFVKPSSHDGPFAVRRVDGDSCRTSRRSEVTENCTLCFGLRIFLGSKGFPVFTKIHNFAPRKTNSVKKGNHTSCAEQQMLWLGVKCCKKAEKRQSFPALLPYPHVTKACPCLG